MKKIFKNYNKILNCFLGLLFINLVVYILFFAKSLLNSDSAFIIDYANEIIKHKSLFPSTWVNTNDFWIYSLIPLITLFIKVGMKFLMARQIAVLIQTIILIIIIIDLYRSYLKDKKGLKIFLMLLLSGISGQVFFEMFGDATYGSIVFYMILELWLFLKYLKKQKIITLIIFGIILTLITGCSLRFPIYIAAPLICCVLYTIYSKNINKCYIKIFVTICLACILGLIINKYLCSSLLISFQTERSLVDTADNLSKGLFNVVYNYFWLCGATNQNVYSLTININNNFITSSSPLIIFSFIRVIYSILTFMLPFILIKKFKQFDDAEKNVYIYVVSLTFILLFFLLFGGMNYWYRYITPVLVVMNLLYPLLYKYFFNSKEKNKIVFGIALVLFSISALFFVTMSILDYKNKSIRKNYYQGIADVLMDNELYFGYTLNGNEHNIYNLLTEGKVQVTRIADDGKKPFYWLNSTDWFKPNYYKGKTFFMRNKYQNGIKEIEKKAIDIIEYKNYYIYVLKDTNVVLSNFE